MSINIQGSGCLVRRLYSSMVNGFMQRNGVPQEKVEQITLQFELLNQPFPVESSKAHSESVFLQNQIEFSILIKELRNCAT